ncbi:MAG: MFS transporter [Pyrinomonadaceae bacterium]|nr:MFS transporter [Pyrinomonadaceae bacterium]
MNYRLSTLFGLGASAILTVLILVGSRNLQNFDSALFGYTVASVIAFGALIFRYALWLQRPATRTYWKRGWQIYLKREKFVQNTGIAAKTFAGNILAQSFILKRGFKRWLMHFLIMWGCIISAMITFPLVFGWVHFELEGDIGYRAYLFGFPLQLMQGRSITAWLTFHALDITAIMVLVGCGIAIHRRLHDRGAIALQQFLLDFVPHLMLIAISVSGLMLTASSLWFDGYMYHFIALTHQATVIMTLFYLPFGKLFHIVQRPASLGVELYRKRSPEMQQAECPRCRTEFSAQIWVDDLNKVIEKLGFDYTLPDGTKLQDHCPQCKRIMRGISYANLPDVNEPVFLGVRAEESKEEVQTKDNV